MRRERSAIGRARTVSFFMLSMMESVAAERRITALRTARTRPAAIAACVLGEEARLGVSSGATTRDARGAARGAPCPARGGGGGAAAVRGASSH